MFSTILLPFGCFYVFYAFSYLSNDGPLHDGSPYSFERYFLIIETYFMVQSFNRTNKNILHNFIGMTEIPLALIVQ